LCVRACVLVCACMCARSSAIAYIGARPSNACVCAFSRLYSPVGARGGLEGAPPLCSIASASSCRA
jgi:hypothetical protein